MAQFEQLAIGGDLQGLTWEQLLLQASTEFRVKLPFLGSGLIHVRDLTTGVNNTRFPQFGESDGYPYYKAREAKHAFNTNNENNEVDVAPDATFSTSGKIDYSDIDNETVNPMAAMRLVNQLAWDHDRQEERRAMRMLYKAAQGVAVSGVHQGGVQKEVSNAAAFTTYFSADQTGATRVRDAIRDILETCGNRGWDIEAPFIGFIDYHIEKVLKYDDKSFSSDYQGEMFGLNSLLKSRIKRFENVLLVPTTFMPTATITASSTVSSTTDLTRYAIDPLVSSDGRPVMLMLQQNQIGHGSVVKVVGKQSNPLTQKDDPDVDEVKFVHRRNYGYGHVDDWQAAGIFYVNP